MPYAVALIGVASFLAGLAIAGGRWVTAAFLITLASAVALWLRWYHLSELEDAFDEGAGYGASTRRRIREIAVLKASSVPRDARRWLNDE